MIQLGGDDSAALDDEDEEDEEEEEVVAVAAKKVRTYLTSRDPYSQIEQEEEQEEEEKGSCGSRRGTRERGRPDEHEANAQERA